jgi:AcrR family transcriptional regulator
MKPRRIGRTPPPGRAAAAAEAPYHHGDLPRTLVAAATQLIESEGGAGRLSLRAAAEAAGVSVAAPYRHFADREALLAATLAQGFDDLARHTERARRAARSPLAALTATGLAYVRFAAKRPRLYRLMFGPECEKAAYPELMRAGHAALAVLHEAVAQCRAAGLIGTRSSVQEVALAGWALVHGLASLHADGLLRGSAAERHLDATAKALMRVLVEGVGEGVR